MRTLHANWSWVVVAANLVVGAWGLWLWRRRQLPSRMWWTALIVAWVTIYLQGMLGLLIFERYRPPFKHHFYGFLFAIITLIVLPIRSEQPRTRLLVFSAATLFIGIVSVRATLSL